MIVLDASVAAELVLRLPGADAATARILRDDEQLHAPHLIDLEVASVLRRCAAVGAIDRRDVADGLGLLRALPIRRHGHEPLLDRVLALRENLTPYDAVYVALAEVLEVPLVTFDGHIARAPGHVARIELLVRPAPE